MAIGPDQVNRERVRDAAANGGRRIAGQRAAARPRPAGSRAAAAISGIVPA
jgi:hypothetical protein